MLYNTNDGRFFSARARRAKTSNLIVYDFSRDSKITPIPMDSLITRQIPLINVEKPGVKEKKNFLMIWRLGPQLKTPTNSKPNEL